MINITKIKVLWKLLVAEEYMLVTQNPDNFESVSIDKCYCNEIETAIGKVCRKQQQSENENK